MLSLFYTTGVALDKRTSACTHCQRVGHTANKCYIRLKEQRKARKQKLSVSGETSMSRQNEMGSMRRPGKTGNAPASYTSSSSPRGATGGTRYCVLHDSTTHSTEDCYTIAKMKRDRSRGCGGAPSEEAERPVKQKPG